MPLSVDQLGYYESEREINKNSLAYGVVIFSKGSLGTGLFLSQYYFVKAGLGPACVFAFLTISLVNGFLIILTKLADDIEERNNVKIETLDELCTAIIGSWFGYIIKFIILLLNLGSVYGTSLLIIQFLVNQLTNSPFTGFLSSAWQVKLLTILVFIVIILLVVEPEKIRFTSLVSAIMFLIPILFLFYFTIQKGVTEGFKGDLAYTDRTYYINYISTLFYGLEVIIFVFTIRSTLRVRKDMTKVILYKIPICTAVFVFFGFIFLVVSLKDV